MAAVTRLGLYGGPRAPYGSFSGKSSYVSVGATSQIGNYSSSGGITLERVIGGTSQIGNYASSGGITLERVIGSTSQLSAYSSSGGITVGEAVVAEAETATGGWFDYWQPTKEQIRKERERLGIIKPEIDQIIRVIKKVSKGQISPQEAKQEAQTYFAKQDLQFFPKHEEAVDNLVSFLTQQTGYNPVEYAAQRAQEAARQAQADQEHQELVLELQAQRDAIEEQDMVFVITCLAA